MRLPNFHRGLSEPPFGHHDEMEDISIELFDKVIESMRSDPVDPPITYQSTPHDTSVPEVFKQFVNESEL